MLSLLATTATALAMLGYVTATPVICEVIIPGPPVVAITPDTPVTGLNLGQGTNGTAYLSSGGFHTNITQTNGGLGFFYGCSTLWLNIADTISPKKPLSFGYTQTTSNWVVESDRIIHANSTGTYPGSSEFLACPWPSASSKVYTVALLTSKVDVGTSGCAVTQLQIGTFGATS